MTANQVEDICNEIESIKEELANLADRINQMYSDMKNFQEFLREHGGDINAKTKN